MDIGIIVQRYGFEINGGAELHARLLAEKLSQNHQVKVITTKALDYVDWNNYYTQDVEFINGIEVIRFDSAQKNHKCYRQSRRRVAEERKITKYIKWMPKKGQETIKKFLVPTDVDFENWLIQQGPYCEALPRFIQKNYDNFDVFIFFTYLYYPTAVGISSAPNKNILIPTAHDEKPFYYKGFSRLFKEAHFIMYNSLSEKRLVEKTYPVSIQKLNDIAGVGFDSPTEYSVERLLDEKYFIYIGRIDYSKNVGELYHFFKQYLKHTKADVKLVFIGKNHTSLKPTHNIIFTGFVSDQDKNQWLCNAEALIIPSKFESLSMVTLEAMQLGIPVIANRTCEVLEDHILLSKAGFSYQSQEEFDNVINRILTMNEKERLQLSKNGKVYVENNYHWDKIVEKFERAFQKINSNTQHHLNSKVESEN